MCVLTNKRHKTYRTGFLFCRLGHAPRVGFGGPRGYFFFVHGHVAYQINADDEYSRMQVIFSPLGQTGDLEVGSKIFKLQ